MALGNGLDNAAFDRFGRHFARGPMTDGALRVRRGFTGQRHDLAPLLDTEGGGCPGTWGILSTFRDRTVGPPQPVAPPASHRETAGPQAASHRMCVVPVCQVQNNLCPEAE